MYGIIVEVEPQDKLFFNDIIMYLLVIYDLCILHCLL